jgi:hypothetical protein
VIRKTHAVFASQLFAFITLAVPFAGEAASRDAAVGSGEDASLPDGGSSGDLRIRR